MTDQTQAPLSEWERCPSPVVVNLIGGPGTGKSTTAAAVYTYLKWRGINAELALEYAKDKVWEGSLGVLRDQPYLLGKQHHRLFCLRGQVDVAVTDSPVLLSAVYGARWGQTLVDLAIELFSRYDNLTYVIDRTRPYGNEGRYQNEEAARLLDDQVLEILEQRSIPYVRVPGTPESTDRIITDVLVRLEERKEVNRCI
jgi:nicotinamide riboside kinase